MTQQEREKEIVRIKLETRSKSESVKCEEREELDQLDRETMEKLLGMEQQVIELNKQRLPLFEDYHGNISEIKRIGILVRELEFGMKNVKIDAGQKRNAINRKYAQRMRELSMERDTKMLELL